MDALKAQIAAKRKAKEAEFGGQKFVKRGDLEQARMRQKEEEEARELAQKVRRSPNEHRKEHCKELPTVELLLYFCCCASPCLGQLPSAF